MDFDNRRLTSQEERLLELLIEKASIKLPANWKESLIVRFMDDGGMGSLYLFPEGVIKENRVLGKQVSEYQFKDKDGVDVIASLNVDDAGELFELDIWKTDFNPLISTPDTLQ